MAAHIARTCVQRSPFAVISASTLFRRTTDRSKLLVSQIATYKSKQSLDILYPNSKLDFRTLPDVQKNAKTDEEFSGIIPVEKIDIKYLKSSGPGGQNVNKVNTKVEIRFHVESADWIPDWVKPKILENEKGRINKNGYMFINSDRTRKQLLNQADCLQKLRTIIFNASYQPQEPTVEEKKFHSERIAKIQKSVLKVKREHSLKKQRRQGPTVDIFLNKKNCLSPHFTEQRIGRIYC
ncbi:ICT1 [Acanthosepion pharaonis]|uniref:Large ribosomal subunit protein mL62 n=1 Tax=Acanthosepion pharaonis TaxID=158019 RepID=A0A812B7W6_ACAPH|nr:ICT1 [Sepia pharaonis]